MARNLSSREGDLDDGVVYGGFERFAEYARTVTHSKTPQSARFLRDFCRLDSRGSTNSRFGMSLVVDGHQFRKRYLGVFLRGGQLGVAEQFLNGPKVRPVA